MTPRANLARPLAFGLCALSALMHAGAARAQAQAAAPLQAPAVTPAVAAAATPVVTPATASMTPPASWSEVNLPGQPVYQDHYIGGGTLAPDISAGELGTDSDAAEGLARSIQIDAVASVLSSRESGTSSNAVEDGLVGKAQWETAQYGAWSLDASARAMSSDAGPSEEGQGGVLTLRQRDMPFDGGWQADNGLGDLNAPDLSLARLQARFYLPTGPMQGATTEWHGPSDMQIVAGVGVPGLYDGIEVPDFRTLGGSTATAGAEWSPAAHWTVGGQFIDAHDVNLAVGPLIDGDSRLSSDAGLLSALWQDQGGRIQFNLLDGEVSGKSNSLGSWVDASITQGHVQQSAGLFRVDPNMTWGNQLIANDAQGGYYRFDYQSRQWTTDFGIDEVRSVDDLGNNTTFLTGDARYQILRDWGVGGVANLSRSDGGSGWSLEGYLDHLDPLGTSRVQADFAGTPAGKDASLTLLQTWTTAPGTRLSTGASVERISGAAVDDYTQDSTMLALSAYGGGRFSARLGMEGNVRWATTVQGRAAPGVSANVSLTYQIAANWQILATYYDSQTASWTPLIVESPLTPPTPQAVPAISERGAFLTLRYQRSSGSHFAPLGGPPGGGSGEIAGIVYLDANANGRIDAGESGVPNLTVVLDGRFSVQTDAAGRFDFPVVASGHHVITVISDNLPLPWSLQNEGRTEIEVTTRGRASVELGAQRLR
ncbi:MAG TPA: SdrD B-like domain-containing protein [Steroidobacteraceae bacterium]|nr:SdrD B-like domain-containing protein [Steroidobacteraceae bacterium]